MIKIENLGVKFGYRWIFNKVNLEVKKGELVIIVGKNGVGKTTFLKVLAGIIEPTTGTIKKKEIEKIGYLGHDTPFFENFSLEENIKFWLELHRKPFVREKVLWYLNKARLGNFFKEKIKYFSAGMIKKADILRVMLIEPDLYLLDEPTSSVDENFFSFFVEKIKELRSLGKVIFWVTHDDRHIIYGDRVLEFKDSTAYLRCS